MIPKTTGTLKKSIPKTPLELLLQMHNTTQYKDKEFPKPLQKKGRFEK